MKCCSSQKWHQFRGGHVIIETKRTFKNVAPQCYTLTATCLAICRKIARGFPPLSETSICSELFSESDESRQLVYPKISSHNAMCNTANTKGSVNLPSATKEKQMPGMFEQITKISYQTS